MPSTKSSRRPAGIKKAVELYRGGMLARDAAFKGAVDGKPDAVNKANAAIAKRKFDEATQQDRVTLGDPALAASSQKLRGYADGGKVVKRKPNGKAC